MVFFLGISFDYFVAGKGELKTIRSGSEKDDEIDVAQGRHG
jgi:hypothetical protein